MRKTVKKIIKRTFVVIFSLFVLILVILSMIDIDKSIAWNVSKFVFCILLIVGMMITSNWMAEWMEEKEEKKGK